MNEFRFKNPEDTEILSISPEGQVRINWPVVEQHAAKWQQGCTDVHIGYCLALVSVKKERS